MQRSISVNGSVISVLEVTDFLYLHDFFEIMNGSGQSFAAPVFFWIHQIRSAQTACRFDAYTLQSGNLPALYSAPLSLYGYLCAWQRYRDLCSPVVYLFCVWIWKKYQNVRII